MNLALRDHAVEKATDAAAAVAFAAAAAFAMLSLFGFPIVPSAAMAFAPVFFILRHIEGAAEFYELREFLPVEFPLSEEATEELLLTAEMLLHPLITQSSDELVLDDVLASLRPDSRVVCLFDPTRMPTASELKSSIDRHHLTQTDLNPPDAAQALSDALAQLRRSLH